MTLCRHDGLCRQALPPLCRHAARGKDAATLPPLASLAPTLPPTVPVAKRTLSRRNIGIPCDPERFMVDTLTIFLGATSGHYDCDIEYDDDNNDKGNDDGNEESNNDNKDNSNDDDEEEEGAEGAIGQERPKGTHSARRPQGRSARGVQ
eukprot:gene15195-biopygen11781